MVRTTRYAPFYTTKQKRRIEKKEKKNRSEVIEDEKKMF
jgi:hypothetical protein